MSQPPVTTTAAAPPAPSSSATLPQQQQPLQQSPLPASKRKRMSESRPAGFSKIGLIGAGNMARAIAEGLIGSGQVAPTCITSSATSPTSENFKKMKSLGVQVTTSNRDVVVNSDVVILTVKPYQVLQIMTEIQSIFEEVQLQPASGHTAPKTLRPLIVSVASSVTVADLEKKTEISWNISGSPIVGHLPVIRCLPTVAVAVRAGVTVYCKGKFCNEGDIKPFLAIFTLLGHCEEVAEKYMDAFTAFTGSGVAFMAVALEAMADGGVLVGIPRAMSQRIAAFNMMSTAKIILEKGQHPAELKDSVASPAGTTINGLQCLERAGFRAALMEAIKTSAQKAVEMRPKN